MIARWLCERGQDKHASRSGAFLTLKTQTYLRTKEQSSSNRMYWMPDKTRNQNGRKIAVEWGKEIH